MQGPAAATTPGRFNPSWGTRLLWSCHDRGGGRKYLGVCMRAECVYLEGHLCAERGSQHRIQIERGGGPQGLSTGNKTMG